VQPPGGTLKFQRTPAPTRDDIKHITQKIACRVHRYLEKRFNELDHDDIATKAPLLAKCYEASIRYLSALGSNAGKPLLRIISQPNTDDDDRHERTIAGFNLHASIAIEGHDRIALERILRYMGRPPLSNERLSLAPDGHRLVVTLKTPWRDGTSQIILTPFELMERLVAIIPPPRKNLIRYHGCFGPNSKIRKEHSQTGSYHRQPRAQKQSCSTYKLCKVDGENIRNRCAQVPKMPRST
jgi:hypothetical protein